ncbi:Peptidase family M1 domain [Rhizoctonia solani]|uniref:Peptidase family M1 domain n=1 Tax=Rhizoctonia solani TaxID=456999 RepID=A0A8H7M3E1_9AGAM|nr:Peptidase family M1 domain [Rhizoctonia solani]
MQRESVRRGFGISHQKVVLQVDIGKKTAHGYTELTVVPLSRDLRTLHLHARCDVHNVSVCVAPGSESIQADFVHTDPTQAVTGQRQTRRALDSNTPKLFPSSIKCTGRRAGLVRSSRHPTVCTRNRVFNTRSSTWAGICAPSESHPNFVPHVFTSPSTSDAARQPSDAMQLDQPTPEPEPEPEFPVVAVASAELTQVRTAHWIRDWSIHISSRSRPTTSDPTATTTTPTPIRTYALPSTPSATLELATTSAPFRPAMSFYTTEYGSYPFGTLSVIFLPTVPSTTSYDCAGLVLLPSTLLHSPAILMLNSTPASLLPTLSLRNGQAYT